MANIIINEISQNYTYNIGASTYATVALPITSCWGDGYFGVSEDESEEDALDRVVWREFNANQAGLEAFVSEYRGAASCYRTCKDFSYQMAVTLLTAGYNVLVCRLNNGNEATCILNTESGKKLEVRAKYPGSFGNSIVAKIRKAKNSVGVTYWNAIVYTVDSTGVMTAVENFNFVFNPETADKYDNFILIDDVESRFIKFGEHDGITDSDTFTGEDKGAVKAYLTGGSDYKSVPTKTDIIDDKSATAWIPSPATGEPVVYNLGDVVLASEVFKGDWATATPYAIGDIVNVSNKFYACMIANQSSSETFSNEPYFEEVNGTEVPISAWYNATTYCEKAIVYMYDAGLENADFYKSLIANNREELSNTSAWSKYDEWVASTAYAVGDYVVYTSHLYECKTANSDAEFDANNWDEVSTYEDDIHAWNKDTVYTTGSIVSDGGKYFVSITNNNRNHSVSDTSYWAVVKNWYEYRDGTPEVAITVGTLVVQDGTIYRCLVEHKAGNVFSLTPWSEGAEDELLDIYTCKLTHNSPIYKDETDPTSGVATFIDDADNWVKGISGYETVSVILPLVQKRYGDVTNNAYYNAILEKCSEWSDSQVSMHEYMEWMYSTACGVAEANTTDSTIYTNGVYGLLQDKLSYSPDVVMSPGWDDQNIGAILDEDYNKFLTVVSPIHNVLMNVAYVSRCATAFIDIPKSCTRATVYTEGVTESGDEGYAQLLSKINLTTENSIYSTHSALFAPWGQYRYVGTSRQNDASPSFLALLIMRSMILNQTLQYFWCLPSNRRNNVRIGKLDYTVNKKYLDIWQEGDGVGVNVITNIPGIGTTIWGNSTLYDVPPATYNALQNLSTRFLVNEIKDVCYRCGIAITYQYNNQEAYSKFYAGVTPTLDTMKNVGAIVDYYVTMSADINALDYVNANSVIGKVYITVVGVINDITIDLIALPQSVDLNQFRI